MNLFGDELSPPETSPANGETDFSAPLAARMRPRTLDEFVGQKHLVGEGAPLRRAAQNGRLPSCIFYGSAGVGKTTLARLLARETGAIFEDFSAIGGGVADVRKIFDRAKERKRAGKTTLLFVDEIHRFNRAQQDSFLPHVEGGTVVLLGATTENPLAALNTPLLSRCRLFAFEPLDEDEIFALLQRAISDERGLQSLGLRADDEALRFLVRMSNGDARAALGALEVAADFAGENGVLSRESAQAAFGTRAIPYDLHGDEHYNTISAFIKSVRGSDPDAALLYLMRMLEGGEDPMFVARRLVILASEDIGLADSVGLLVANAALSAVEKIGMPEAAIPLAHATVYLAGAPKSNSAYVAMHRAKAWVREGQNIEIPRHLRSTGLGKKLGNGQGYKYPHDEPEHFVEENYWPEGVAPQKFFEAGELGAEAKLARRLAELWRQTKE